jgi:hypothetical protein
MTLTKTIAGAAALFFAPALTSAALAQSHDHGAAGQQQHEPAKPQGTPCPMMQDMHGGMKMDGKAMPHDQSGAQPPATGSGAGGMKAMGEMKCMHDGTAGTAAPQEEHSHDHSAAGRP